MANMASGKHRKPTVALNPDLLGFAAATFFGTVAMALAFWRGADGLQVALGVGVTFLVTYTAVFMFVRYVLRVVLMEVVEAKRKAREDEAARRATEEGARVAPLSGPPQGESR